MKRVSTILILLAIAIGAAAQSAAGSKASAQGGKTVQTKRVYEIKVSNQPTVEAVEANNDSLKRGQDEATRSLLGDALTTAFGTSLVQRTVAATSNVLSLAVDALSNKRDKWLRTAQSYCTYSATLPSQSNIDDFYLRPSTQGAMDPTDIKFAGVGCRSYLQTTDNPQRGREVFFIWCSLRTDSVGIRKMTDHSKFLLQVDSLRFAPLYCALPNDSAEVRTRYDFDKYSDLTLRLDIRFYSSWINEAIMVTTDQQLGQFTVTARIDPDRLTADTVFVYRRTDAEANSPVSITGESFIVPRSYTGTNDGTTYQPSWGTGQYRVEMAITETCTLNQSYYYVPTAGSAEAVSDAALPGAHKWDKRKWKTEWKQMQARSNRSFFSNAWQGVVTAYRGTGWLQTLTDPLTTAIYEAETEALYDWLDLSDTSTAGTAAM